MKNIKILSSIGAFFVLMTFGSCSDEAPIGSSITNYAVFDLEAGPLAVVPLGGTFTPTAVATEGDTEIPVTISGSVDTSTVGVYTVTYSATNADGFDATATQTVIVHDPSIVGTDVSGRIRDKGNNTRTGVITLIEGTTSIFYVTDFGFAGAFPIYFQMDGDTISEVEQVYPLSVTSVGLSYNPITQEFSVGPIQPYGFNYTFEYY